MSRTIRSEFAANHLQAARVTQQAADAMARESVREDWRRVLARRDAKRSAVRNARPARRESGFALASALQGVAAVCFALVQLF